MLLLSKQGYDAAINDFNLDFLSVDLNRIWSMMEVKSASTFSEESLTMPKHNTSAIAQRGIA